MGNQRRRALFTGVADPDDFRPSRSGSIGCYRLGHGWTDGDDGPDKRRPDAVPGDIPMSAFDAMPPRVKSQKRADADLAEERRISEMAPTIVLGSAHMSLADLAPWQRTPWLEWDDWLAYMKYNNKTPDHC